MFLNKKVKKVPKCLYNINTLVLIIVIKKQIVWVKLTDTAFHFEFD